MDSMLKCQGTWGMFKCWYVYIPWHSGSQVSGLGFQDHKFGPRNILQPFTHLTLLPTTLRGKKKLI